MKAWASAIVMIASTIAVPATADEQPVVRISYHFADLATSTGRSAVRRNIEQAINTVCGRIEGPASMLVASDIRACRRAALAQANRQYDEALLAAGSAQRLAQR